MQKNSLFLIICLIITNCVYAGNSISSSSVQSTEKETISKQYGTALGYAAAFYPLIGTGVALYSTYVSPVFPSYDMYEDSSIKQSAVFTDGLKQGHIAGLITNTMLLAALYRYSGREGVFYGMAIPWLVFFALNFPGKPS